jgi:hypothetical protein
MTTMNLIDDSEARPRRKPLSRGRRRRDRGVCIATLVGFRESGEASVRWSGATRPLPARSVIELTAADVGADVVLAFERGLRQRPIVMGRLRAAAAAGTRQVFVDGAAVAVSAERELSLRCGSASITLTRAGKVIIRGAYIVSRSSGVNRIKGGSVQIN